MAYTRATVIDPGPAGDTVKEAVLKNDTDLSNIFTHLNTHEGKASTHGVTGDLVGTTDAQILSNKTLTSPVLNTGVSGTAILDEDDLATNSATQLATQQSIKAYVDAYKTIVDAELDFFNGTFLESFDALVTSNGTVVTMSLEQSGGGDLTAVFSSGRVVLDCDPTPLTIALTAGDDNAPQVNYVYILESTGNLTKDTSQWPATEHVKVAYFLVPSATAVQSDGCYINQNWNDHRQNTNEQGHLSHLCEAIRLTMDGANWHSGVEPNGDASTYIVTTGSPDEIYFKATAGVAFQMHKHTVPAWNMQTSDDLHVVNWNGDAYHAVTDIASIVEDAEGVSITNRYYNIVFWGTANKTGEYSPLMCNLSTGSYVRLADAILDTDQHDVTGIPSEFTKDSTIGFLICRLTFKKVGTDFTLHNTVDLRGVAAGASAGAGFGGGGGGGTEFADNVFTVYDSDDVTRILDFDLSSITTGNTRTITPADADMTLLSTTDYTDLTDAGATSLHKHDHGGQDGLGDDDHTQYLLHDGTRALTGDWDVGAFGISQQWLQFDTDFVDGTVEGRIQWNSDDGTLEYGLPGGNVTLQIGQEQLVKCSNKSGGDILNGEVVYIDGAQGSRPTIALASSDQGTGKVPIGVATEDIDNDADGYVNVGGLVRDMDTSTISSGGIAFLSDTVPGALRASPPAAPNYTTIVGYCIFSNDVAGILFVRILSAPRMQSMSDVDHTAPSVDGQFYRWDESGEKRFELAGDSSIDHGTISGLGDDDHTQYFLKTGGIISGNVTLTAQNLTTKHVTSPYMMVWDTTNDVKLYMQCIDASALIGTYTAHNLSIYAHNAPAITFSGSTGQVSGQSIKDEDDLTSDSAVHLATQQSIKAYVDTYAIMNALADAENDFLIASGANVFVKKTLAETGAILEGDINHDNLVGYDAAKHFVEGDIDHGNIAGLGDDDHTQYLLKTGGTITGTLSMSNAQIFYAETIRAIDASGLLLYNDGGGLGIEIQDDGDVRFGQHVILAPTKILWFDGGTHTYIRENPADTLLVYAGGSNVLSLTTTGVTGTVIKDEDDMSSNSATHLATQQSIKKYVDDEIAGVPTDHGGFDGLGDDDHSQYLLADMSRDFADVNTNSLPIFSMTNSNAGAAAGIEFDIRNADGITHALRLVVLGENFTTVGGFIQDGAAIVAEGNLAGGLQLMTRQASAPIRFYTGTHTNLVMSLAAGAGGITGSVIKDEDDMTSDSAVHLATQQSIKKYVDDEISGLTTDHGGLDGLSDDDHGQYVMVDNNRANVNTRLTGGYFGLLEGCYLYLTGEQDAAAEIYMSADQAVNNADKWLITAIDGDGLHLRSYASGSWVTVLGLASTGIQGTAIKDEDNMASDSAVHLATQQSIKKYVDDLTGGGGVGVSGTPVEFDIARFTDANTIEGRSYAEFKGDLDLEIGTDILAQQTIGIADNNLVEIDHAGVVDNDYAKFTAAGLEGRSASEVRTDLGIDTNDDVVLGSVTCGDTKIGDHGIQLDMVPDADGEWCGSYVDSQVDANSIGFGGAMHMDTDSHWINSDADTVAGMPCLGISVEAGTGVRKVLVHGFVKKTAWAWTPGAILFASATVGLFTHTAPAGVGDQVQSIGIAIDADTIFFNPSTVLVERD